MDKIGNPQYIVPVYIAITGRVIKKAIFSDEKWVATYEIINNSI